MSTPVTVTDLVTISNISTSTLIVGETWVINQGSYTYTIIPPEFDGVLKTQHTKSTSYPDVTIDFHKNVEVLAWVNGWNTSTDQQNLLTSLGFSPSTYYIKMNYSGEFNTFSKTYNKNESVTFSTLGYFHGSLGSFIHLAFRELPNQPVLKTSVGANVVANAWNYVSFTYNKLTNSLNMFVNDQNVGTFTDVELNTETNHNEFYVGKNTVSETSFVGDVDDIVVYNRQLAPEQLYAKYEPVIDTIMLQNKVAGHWTFNDLKVVLDEFVDKSLLNSKMTVVGNVTIGENQTVGNRSLVFDGTPTTYVESSNASLDASELTVGTWVKPNALTAQTFVEKDGVFQMGMTNTGVPVMNISDTDTSSLVLDTRTEHAAIVSDVNFTNEITDSVGTVVSSNSITYTPSFNPDVRVNKQAAVFNGVDSEVILGPVLNSINNKLTMSAWLNVANLLDGQSYPIISTSTGLSWNINKAGGVLSTDLSFPTFPTINQSYTVPGTYTWVSPGTGKITLKLQGGNGGTYTNTSKLGGSGGYIAVDIDVVGGVEYTIIVGGRGEDQNNTAYGSKARHGGGGGGGSGFKVSTDTDWMVVAGGGGGSADTGVGGDGGFLFVWNGSDGVGSGKGYGGTTIAGGANGTGRKAGVAGTQYDGGRAGTEKVSDVLGGTGIGNGGNGGIGGNDFCGGGGGGGWFGGGGGAVDGSGHGGGGGGGSSYYDESNTNVDVSQVNIVYNDNSGNGSVSLYNYVAPVPVHTFRKAEGLQWSDGTFKWARSDMGNNILPSEIILREPQSLFNMTGHLAQVIQLRDFVFAFDTDNFMYIQSMTSTRLWSYKYFVDETATAYPSDWFHTPTNGGAPFHRANALNARLAVTYAGKMIQRLHTLGLNAFLIEYDDGTLHIVGVDNNSDQSALLYQTYYSPDPSIVTVTGLGAGWKLQSTVRLGQNALVFMKRTDAVAPYKAFIDEFQQYGKDDTSDGNNVRVFGINVAVATLNKSYGGVHHMSRNDPITVDLYNDQFVGTLKATLHSANWNDTTRIHGGSALSFDYQEPLQLYWVVHHLSGLFSEGYLPVKSIALRWSSLILFENDNGNKEWHLINLAPNRINETWNNVLRRTAQYLLHQSVPDGTSGNTFSTLGFAAERSTIFNGCPEFIRLQAVMSACEALGNGIDDLVFVDSIFNERYDSTSLNSTLLQVYVKSTSKAYQLTAGSSTTDVNFVEITPELLDADSVDYIDKKNEAEGLYGVTQRIHSWFFANNVFADQDLVQFGTSGGGIVIVTSPFAEVNIGYNDVRFNGVRSSYLEWDFYDNASVLETINGDSSLEMNSLDGGAILFESHPNKAGKTALYLDRNTTSNSAYIGLVSGVPADIFPTDVFSIQYRMYMVDDGAPDSFDIRLDLGMWLISGSSNSSIRCFLNGKFNSITLTVVDSGVSTSETISNLHTTNSYDLWGTGSKVFTIVKDTYEARFYINGILAITTSFAGTFAAGLVGTTSRPITIRQHALDIDDPPGSDMYIESVRVYDSILTGSELR